MLEPPHFVEALFRAALFGWIGFVPLVVAHYRERHALAISSLAATFAAELLVPAGGLVAAGALTAFTLLSPKRVRVWNHPEPRLAARD